MHRHGIPVTDFDLVTGAGSLSRSFVQGAASVEPVAFVIGGRGILGARKDTERISEWTKRFVNPNKIMVENDVSKRMLEPIFEGCRRQPTFLYLNGHASSLEYFPQDCGSGISFERTRQLLIDTPRSMKLVMVTDMCECSNFLKLPFVAYCTRQGWVWNETKEYQADPDGFGDERKKILHFAATDESGAAYSWESIGGVFTKEFSNVSPGTGLGKRLDQTQAWITPILDKHAGGVVQFPQLYSSHKFDFEKENILSVMGVN
ncbi:hypothetical protein RhiJN_23708 [Ceratobasidium sp. AG-Ba]|nr:hypothetical protein RhiJN_23708 [Ceratobasidium sp. AG-Ba]